MVDLLVTVGTAVLGGVLAYFFGYRRAGKVRRAKESERRLRDVKKAQEVRDEVESLGDDDLADRAGQWVRSDD